MVGIAEPAGNEPRVHVQRLGGDLGQGRLGALTDLLPAGHQDKGSVLVHTDDGRAACVGGLRGGFPARGHALPALSGGGRVHRLFVILDVFQHLLQTVMEAGDLHHLSGSGNAAGAQAVDAPHLSRVHPDLQGYLVDILLDGEMDLAHAEAAIGAAHGMVGIDAVAVGPDVWDVVGPRRGPATCLGNVNAVLGVRSSVPYKLVLDGLDLSVPVDPGLDPAVQALADIGILELILPGVVQLHRPAAVAPGQRYDDALQSRARFGAEAAPHIG